MSSASPETCVSESRLPVGYLNVYHLFNKVPDVPNFLCNQYPFIHLFGLSETRLNCRVSDESIAIPHYAIYRRDIVKQGETGLALYVDNFIQNITTRHTDLESQCIESLWVEMCIPKTPSLLVEHVYQDPAATYEWYDEFVAILDKVSESKSNGLLLGVFNIDLLKPHWESTFPILGLNQLITQPTRVTCSTNTLTDHIHTNNPNLVHSIPVPNIAISDHFPVLCTWSVKLPRRTPKDHTTIQYRTFKQFNKDAFLFDLLLSVMFIRLIILMMLCQFGTILSCQSSTFMLHYVRKE